MKEISFIGCGRMGSAMIRALATQDNSLTIWNRTSAKANALVQSNVNVAGSFGSAVDASPMIAISIWGYDSAMRLFREHVSTLQGKTVVQLSSGKPGEARELHDLVKSLGGAYIDGSVMGYPSHVGTPEMQILYSGNPSAFEDCRSVLEQIGGSMFVGEDAGYASALESASLFPAIPMLVGLLQGVKLCHKENFPFDVYESFVKQVIPFVVDDTLRKVKDESFASSPEQVQATVAQAVDVAQHFVDLCRDIGTDPGIFEALQALWARGVANGRGDLDWICSADL